jgi:hypothetical protein
LIALSLRSPSRCTSAADTSRHRASTYVISGRHPWP